MLVGEGLYPKTKHTEPQASYSLHPVGFVKQWRPGIEHVLWFYLKPYGLTRYRTDTIYKALRLKQRPERGAQPGFYDVVRNSWSNFTPRDRMGEVLTPAERNSSTGVFIRRSF
jgi:hypothetical protein